jgi:hypothetical protein
VEGDPEAINGFFRTTNASLAGILENPKDLLAWRCWQYDRTIKDSGWDPVTGSGRFDKRYEELNMPARDRGHYTKKEAAALEECLKEMLGPPQ